MIRAPSIAALFPFVAIGEADAEPVEVREAK